MAKLTSARTCLPCTACCDGWLEFDKNGIKTSVGCPCPHSTAAGCNIYEHRPVDPCQLFVCAWRMNGSPLPDWLKPDNSRAIVVFNRLVWRGIPVVLAFPVGRKIPPRTVNWLKQFAESGRQLLIWSEQIATGGVFTGKLKIAALGPPDFLAWVEERVRNDEKMW